MNIHMFDTQVGQCGNQIGCRFWEMALKEHAATSKDACYDEPLSSFFRNVEARCESHILRCIHALAPLNFISTQLHCLYLNHPSFTPDLPHCPLVGAHTHVAFTVAPSSFGEVVT